MNSTLRIGLFSLLLATCVGFVGTECLGATLTYSSGTHTFASNLNSNDVPPIVVSGAAQLTVTGTVIDNSGVDEPALLAMDSGVVTLIGGRLSAQSSGANGSKPRAGIRLLGMSRLIFHSGQIDEGGSGIDLDRAAILAEDNSEVLMFGGSAQVIGSGINSARTGILARGNSSVSVFGGAILANGTGDGPRHELEALDNATITVYGGGFNFPFGPISALSGRLTGSLRNGSPIDWSFTRGAGAAIILAVPEPSARTLILLVAASAAPAITTRLRINCRRLIGERTTRLGAEALR